MFIKNAPAQDSAMLSISSFESNAVQYVSTNTVFAENEIYLIWPSVFQIAKSVTPIVLKLVRYLSVNEGCAC